MEKNIEVDGPWEPCALNSNPASNSEKRSRCPREGRLVRGELCGARDSCAGKVIKRTGKTGDPGNGE